MRSFVVDGHANYTVERAVSEIEAKIKNAYPAVTRIFIEAQNWQAHRRAL